LNLSSLKWTALLVFVASVFPAGFPASTVVSSSSATITTVYRTTTVYQTVTVQSITAQRITVKSITTVTQRVTVTSQQNTTEATTTLRGMPPLMLKGLIFIPGTVSFLLIVGLMVGGLVEHRQGHVSRPAMVGNAFLLWQILYGDWNLLPDWLQLYLNIGTIVAAAALGSYLLRASLPSEFYVVGYLFYGSVSVLIVIMWWTKIYSLAAVFLPVILFFALLWLFVRVLLGPRP